MGNKGSEMLKIIQEGEEEAIFKINIEDLVNETLENNNKSLSVLVETEMAQALEDFIVKRHINAISDQVQETLERMQKDLLNDKEANGRSSITEAAIRIKKKIEDSIRKGEKQQDRKENGRGQPAVGGQSIFDQNESDIERKLSDDEYDEIASDKMTAMRGELNRIIRYNDYRGALHSF